MHLQELSLQQIAGPGEGVPELNELELHTPYLQTHVRARGACKALPTSSITKSLTKGCLKRKVSNMPLHASINLSKTIRCVLQARSMTPDLRQSRIKRRFVLTKIARITVDVFGDHGQFRNDGGAFTQIPLSFRRQICHFDKPSVNETLDNQNCLRIVLYASII